MRRTRRGSRRAVVLALLAATSVAACDDDGGNDGDDRSVEAFCARAENLEDASLAGIDVTDPAALDDALADARANLEELVSAAPDDPDLTEPLGAAHEANLALAALVGDLDPSDPDALASLIGELQVLSEDLTSATQEVQGWIAEHCSPPGTSP